MDEYVCVYQGASCGKPTYLENVEAVVVVEVEVVVVCPACGCGLDYQIFSEFLRLWQSQLEACRRSHAYNFYFYACRTIAIIYIIYIYIMITVQCAPDFSLSAWLGAAYVDQPVRSLFISSLSFLLARPQDINGEAKELLGCVVARRTHTHIYTAAAGWMRLRKLGAGICVRTAGFEISFCMVVVVVEFQQAAANREGKRASWLR